MVKKSIRFLLFVLLLACTTKSEEERTLAGFWDARWVVVSEEVLKDLPEDINTKMNGEIVFLEDHRVIISGYGYPGCLFAQDTIRNELKWKLEDQSIRLFNDADSFRMEYIILLLEQDTASFNFLDDFNILLKKQ